MCAVELEENFPELHCNWASWQWAHLVGHRVLGC
jgi:hypothetical protein